MNKLYQLHWPLILRLGALALIRLFLHISAVMDALGRPFGPILLTLVISVVWLSIIVFTNIRQPFLTLVFTGILYGVFVISINGFLAPLLSVEQASSRPYAVAMVVLPNALWGASIGLIAVIIQRRRWRDTARVQLAKK